MEPLHEDVPPLSTDLKVSLQRCSTILPAEKTQRRSIFLSNIDQVLNFTVESVHFFLANPAFPPETVAQMLERALQKLLVEYDFLAGRLRFNPQQGRLEIDCNSAGVGFSVATSELSLEEVGDLVYPNPAFGQLMMDKLCSLETDDQPLCALQVTSFRCGGFAMGVCTNHVLFDGIGFKMFLHNLASLVGNKPLAVTPCNDRQLLAARSPPTINFPHPELVRFEIPNGIDQSHTTALLQSTYGDLEFKIFPLSTDDIYHLKEKAKLGQSKNGPTPTHATSFNVVTAHVWRCMALAKDVGQSPEKKSTSTVLYAADIRRRLSPPLPPSYGGNAVVMAYATASFSEIEGGPFSHLVEMVSDGARRLEDEYIRSVIDWGELNKGFPMGDVLISSWWRLGFSQVEYPWGRPKYCCPIVHHKKDLILLLPDINEDTKGNGVNVLVALPIKELKKFQSLFNELLA
ncbi:PREDICTED: omega-hydroxypalmitate O-feruloyl transferase-like [Nelumbo nucifera]|uniref:Omega-hydroxypalmitate O-feruloyl transferase-like n=2 Tax=Nelumbo nucifera TaxID=4432 RepID=A0A822XZW1_NELNU|nr:PREDICTED: omega-hydroxypalmitate O-feruloyl transferase-like [Nelumbo nucifera]DAD25293.1 TPA_asm: hypothetical protein HUJ06_026757 [Nelumbo nucifera]